MSNAERKRKSRERKAAAEGRAVRPWGRRHTPEEKREHKLLQKREYRKRDAESAGREYRPKVGAWRHDAHVKEWLALNQKQQLHDAHVRHLKYILRARARWAKANKAHVREARIERRARDREAIDDKYLRRLSCVKKGETPQALLDLKRAHLRLKRLIRQLGDKESSV